MLALLFSQNMLGQNVHEQHLFSFAYSRENLIASEEEFIRCAEQANIKIEDIPEILRNHGFLRNTVRCYIIGNTYFIPSREPKGYMSKDGIYINYEDGSYSVAKNTEDHYWGFLDKKTNYVYVLIFMDMKAAEPFMRAEIYSAGAPGKPYHAAPSK